MVYLIARLKGMITAVAAFACGLIGTLVGTASLLNTFELIDIGDNVVSMTSGIISLLLARITVAFIQNAKTFFAEAAHIQALKFAPEPLAE